MGHPWLVYNVSLTLSNELIINVMSTVVRRLCVVPGPPPLDTMACRDKPLASESAISHRMEGSTQSRIYEIKVLFSEDRCPACGEHQRPAVCRGWRVLQMLACIALHEAVHASPNKASPSLCRSPTAFFVKVAASDSVDNIIPQLI